MLFIVYILAIVNVVLIYLISFKLCYVLSCCILFYGLFHVRFSTDGTSGRTKHVYICMYVLVLRFLRRVQFLASLRGRCMPPVSSVAGILHRQVTLTLPW